MAIEKFIRGKRDNARHDGLYSNKKRLEESQDHLEECEQLYYSMVVYRQRDRLPDWLVEYHTNILLAWGLLYDGTNDQES